jgi:soluble lytic murein transglycosylase
MRVIRLGAQHGYVLPDRGYPIRNVPDAPEGAEPAMVFGITRQESGFDPFVRSPVGARGMMQLMPRTAEVVARRIGEPYSASMLDEPEYNMRLGSAYLGHMINNFNGSYVMAAAAYNAGPGRPLEWITYCGDPRAAGSDPADFIECIPFSETRNYVMRVMEAAEVYRARLNGGTAPLTLASDLKRGGYAYARTYTPTAAVASPSTPASAPVAPAPLASATRPPSSVGDAIGGVIDASTPARSPAGFTVQGAVP